MASVINDDRKPRKKSKHRKEKEETPEKSKRLKDNEEGDGSVNELGKETRKKEKKKKKQHNSDTQKDDVILAEEDAVASKGEKKKRKRDIEINDGEADAKPLPKKQKKTHKSDNHESVNLKRKKSKSAGRDNEETPETTKSRKKSKKIRMNKTGFLDPEQDEETDLPEQARKALSYAFCQFHNPDNWKFNKARQNWLVRNIWNFQSLPEKYEDLVVKYLSAVQGNTRENIVKTCKMTLDQSNTNGASDKPVSAGGSIIDTHTPSNNGDHKKARARALLKALAPESAS